MSKCPECSGELVPQKVVWTLGPPAPSRGLRCPSCKVTWLLFLQGANAPLLIDIRRRPSSRAPHEWLEEQLGLPPSPRPHPGRVR